MPIAEELIALLGFKVTGEDQVKKFNDTLGDTEDSAKRSTSRMKGLGVAVGGITTAALAIGTSGYKNFAAFERQITRIGITAGASVEKTTAAGDAVKQMAFDFGMPIEQAVTGLDTLVSSGQSLEQAMAFLPSVLTTAQASGAATEDIANTALKASSALGIQAAQLQDSFDIMVAGGKAGQFELKDMATYIPELANSFATLGYSGQDGLKTLIALLQTVREDSGSAGTAATNLQNVFGKIYSAETATAFKKMGVDLPAALEKAKAAGEDTVAAFVRISNEATKGDLTKLPLLFTDQQFRLGMQSLMTSADSYKKFIDTVNSSEVKGSTLSDLTRVLADSQTELDQLSTSWDNFMKSVGGTVAPVASPVLDNITSGLSNAKRADDIRAARGDSKLSRIWAWGSVNEDADLVAQDKAAREASARDGTPYAPPAAAASPLARDPATASPEVKAYYARKSAMLGIPNPLDAVAAPAAPLASKPLASSASPAQTAAAAPAAVAPSVDTSQLDAAQAQLQGIEGATATAKAFLDLGSFIGSAGEAKSAMVDLGQSVTGRADLDIAPLLAKIDTAEAALARLRANASNVSMGQASGNVVAPRPAVVQSASTP